MLYALCALAGFLVGVCLALGWGHRFWAEVLSEQNTIIATFAAREQQDPVPPQIPGTWRNYNA